MKISTSNKMLLLANGFSKQKINWTQNDEKVLSSLVPDKEKLIKLLKKKK